jgi:hypothetical protein
VGVEATTLHLLVSKAGLTAEQIAIVLHVSLVKEANMKKIKIK